jgi:hypothetical protein
MSIMLGRNKDKLNTSWHYTRNLVICIGDSISRMLKSTTTFRAEGNVMVEEDIYVKKGVSIKCHDGTEWIRYIPY